MPRHRGRRDRFFLMKTAACFLESPVQLRPRSVRLLLIRKHPHMAAFQESRHSSSSELDDDWNSEFSLTKETALELQQKLLESFTAPSFQLRLHELGRKYRASKGTDRVARAGFKQLVRSAQFKVIPEYGFQCSEDGVQQMLRAFEELEEDSDIYVNSTSINEALFSEAKQYPDIVQDDEFNTLGGLGVVTDKPQTKVGIMEFLHALLVRYSDPVFQDEIEHLKMEADKRAGRVLVRGFLEPVATEDPDGYYHLPGRQELALEVQQDVLPLFGFEGNRKGVREMIRHCTPYLDDLEVQRSFDAINQKLGMSRAAALRFRQLVQEIQGTAVPLLIGLGRANSSTHPNPLFQLTKPQTF
eukprot:Skav210132  [mRNA]  locus=scaffold2194:547200:567803:+ [translate_table: standard]